MIFTDDEVVITVEALREYRLRIADRSRQVVCDALIYRFCQQLVDQNRTRILQGEA